MAETPGSEARPLINENPELQSYYQSLESRVGYRLVLGGTRHFGYWYVRMLSLYYPPVVKVTSRSRAGAGEEGQGCCLVRAAAGWALRPCRPVTMVMA